MAITGVSAPLMSAVLGQAIELAITSGYVVAARGAAPPGVEDLVGMAAGGARRVDAADVLRAESLGLRLVGRDGLAMPMPTTAVTARNVQKIVRVIQVSPLPKPPRCSCPNTPVFESFVGPSCGRACVGAKVTGVG